MKPTRIFPLLAAAAVIAAGSAQAAIYSLPGFTRTAAGAATTTTIDFVPSEGWIGTPPNAISGEDSLYLTMTVSWTATANIGTFSARFNFSDDAGAARWSMGTEGAGFSFLTGNAAGDGDGGGPATVKPTIVAVDKTAVTTVTLVMKVDQLQAAITPGGDYWYGNTVTPGAQDNAAGFVWINPNLAAAEAGQSTPWAAWRSGNTSYQGVSFISDTADSDLTFSNIAIYTGTDTPFAIPEPSAALLGGLGLLTLLRRRRND